MRSSVAEIDARRAVADAIGALEGIAAAAADRPLAPIDRISLYGMIGRLRRAERAAIRATRTQDVGGGLAAKR